MIRDASRCLGDHGDGAARDVLGRRVRDRGDLLILNVDTYVRSCSDDVALASHLLCGWPSYIAYIVSFLTIGIIWANHHTVMNQIARADRTFLMLTVGFLMVVAFIPFPTGLVAENINGPGARAATVTYGIAHPHGRDVQRDLVLRGWRRRLLREADGRIVRGCPDALCWGVDLSGSHGASGDRPGRGGDAYLRLVL
jgi:hypothetical protein